MTKPTAAANADGLPEDPLSHHIDEARYNLGLAGDLCQALAMSCDALAEPHRTGMMAIHRALDQRIDDAYEAAHRAYRRATDSAVEVRS